MEERLAAAPVDGLIGRPKRRHDLNMVVPMPFHLGYHESPIPGLLKGFGHIGLGGTLGWADPATGSAFARPIRNAITAAPHNGAMPVPRYGATFRAGEARSDVPKKRVAGRR